MNPREAALLSAAAVLLGHNRDTAYGPAHAVRDALALETEVALQAGALQNPDDAPRSRETSGPCVVCGEFTGQRYGGSPRGATFLHSVCTRQYEERIYLGKIAPETARAGGSA